MITLTPEGYCPIREAIHEIVSIVTAGRENTPAINKVLAGGHVAPAELPELEEAAKLFWAKVDEDRVSVCVGHPASGVPLVIDPGWLEGVPFIRRYRGGCNLTSVRPRSLLHRELARLFGPDLSGIRLLVKKSEVDRMLREFRGPRKRKARTPASGKSAGRPAKKPDVKAAILEIVRGRNWDGSRSLKSLISLLRRAPFRRSESDSTISRAVDELAATGERRCRRMKKADRRQDRAA